MITSWLGKNPQAASRRQAVALSLLPPAWTKQATCAQLPIDVSDRLFFAESGCVPAAVREMCAACPVAVQCDAAGKTEEFGVRAGLRPAERGVPRRR